jgi:hypothetical protein
MKNLNIFKSLLLAGLLFLNIAVHAQYKVKQVIVANGGIFFGPGNQVTMGSYDPGSRKYTIFDSVPGNSVTQVLINDKIAFVATDSYLVSYNLDNLKRINITAAPGLRYIAMYKNMIAASIGDDGKGTGIHFKLFKQSDLSMIYAETKIPVYSEGITVAGDSAYIAMQGGYPKFNDSGKIAVVDLVNHKLQRIITLDTATRGIGRLFSNRNTVIGVTDYPYDEISEINVKSGAVKIMPTVLSNPFEIFHDSLYGDIFGRIGTFDLSTSGTKLILKEKTSSYASAAIDTIHKLFYYTGGDYSKATKTWIADFSGALLDSFNVGISPQGIAIDYRDNSGIDGKLALKESMQLFPNPARNKLYIKGITLKNAEICILDMTGKTIASQNSDLNNNAGKGIDISQLPNGLYMLSIRSAEGMIAAKFIKN